MTKAVKDENKFELNGQSAAPDGFNAVVPWNVGRGMCLDRDETRLASEHVNPDLYKNAEKEGLTPSAFLERIDPTPEGEVGDALLRQLALKGLRMRAAGSKLTEEYAASTVEMLRDQAPVLFPEYLRRVIAKASLDPQAFLQERFYASNTHLSDLLSPSRLDKTLRATSPVRRSRLSQLVSQRETINESSWTKIYVDSDPTSFRLARVTECAELPVVQIEALREVIGRTRDFGCQIRWSDKVEKYWTLPLLEWHIGQILAQAEVDKEDEAVLTLVAGDGSPNSGATVIPISTLFGGVAGSISASALVHFLLLWSEEGRFEPSFVAGRVLDLVKMTMVNMGTANLPFLFGQTAMLQNVFETLGAVAIPRNVVATASAVSGQLMFGDSSAALRMMVESGSPLEETDRLIDRRCNLATYSESYGFDWLMPGSVKALDFLN